MSLARDGSVLSHLETSPARTGAMSGTVPKGGQVIDGIPEQDSFSGSAAHGPELTVQQTIYFAARAQNRGGHPSSDDVGQLTDALAAIFGLRSVLGMVSLIVEPNFHAHRHLKNLLMGDSKISQAERRRVAICEALAARASVCCWDKSSQALDACAALDFIQALRIATDLSSMATIVTLSQGGETLYQLFDKVCVIGEGRMLYYGKADVARQYFTGLGHEPLPRQSTSDFLISGRNLTISLEKTAQVLAWKSQILSVEYRIQVDRSPLHERPRSFRGPSTEVTTEEPTA